MTQVNHIHTNSNDCISQHEMIAYLKGSLSPVEMNRIERHLLDCEMCSDEFEGLSMLENPESITSITNQINAQILSSPAKNKMVVLPFRKFMAAAAAILILFGVSYIAYIISGSKHDTIVVTEHTVKQIDMPISKPIDSISEPIEIEKQAIPEPQIILPDVQDFDESNSELAKVLEQEQTIALNYTSTNAPVAPITPSVSPQIIMDSVSIVQVEAKKPALPRNKMLVRDKSFSGTSNVSGILIDKSTGEPLIGASVSVTGTTNGTFTDYDGSYELELEAGSYTLEFSYMGYSSDYKTITISDSKPIAYNSELEQDVVMVQSVVKTGYMSQKKEDVTGGISQIKGEEIADKPVLAVDQALQGKAAGVQVRSNSGTPGGSMDIVIRGRGTLGDARPLYVVDGVPVGNEYKGDPSNIESISILKDASSCALYGARGANGVILITTKGGNSVDSGELYWGAEYTRGKKEDFEDNIRMSILSKKEYRQINLNFSIFCTITQTGALQVNETTIINNKAFEDYVITLVESSEGWRPAKRGGKPIPSKIIFNIDIRE